MESIYIKSNEEFTEKVIKADSPVIVDFYADWCGPCRMLAPTIEALAEEGKAVYKVNVDELPGLASDFEVSSIPTVISFKSGSEHKRQVGLADKKTILGLIE